MSFYNNIFLEFQRHYSLPCGCDHGASKMVIIIPKINIVVKIPFIGDGCAEYGGARTQNEKDSWNYCQKELETYIMAKIDGVEKAFAKVQKIGFVQGHPIYIQEIADPLDKIYGNYSNHSKKEKDFVKDFFNTKTTKFINSDWSADMVRCNGELFFEKLIRFIEKLDIIDLRTSNIGYIDNRPVLIDYAGFEE